MGRLTSIVAIDERGAIGCKNALPWALKSDMAFFKSQTVGNAVIMGRKTFDSIGKPLPSRENIVLSHNNVLFAQSENCKLALSLQEVFLHVSRSRKKEFFVIGGAQTYSQFSDYVERYLVTRVRHTVVSADAFLDESIITSLNDWNAKNIKSVNCSDGVDDYSFDVIEYTPRDLEIRKSRQAQILDLAKERCIRPRNVMPGRKVELAGTQETFAF